LTDSSIALAIEATLDATGLAYSRPEMLPPGNASFTYSYPEDRVRSYQEQLAKVGVGIVVRFPSPIDTHFNSTTEQNEGGSVPSAAEFQMEFVCVRVNDTTTSESKPQPTNTGSSMRAGVSLVLGTLALIVACMEIY